MTDEYMQKKWEEIEERMKRFEETASPSDKMVLDCMVRDYEAKQRLILQNEKEKETISGEVSPW